MVRTVLLIIAIIILTINIILTIMEARMYYHETFSSGGKLRRIQGESSHIEAAGVSGMSGDHVRGYVKIAGMKYNVEWLVLGKVGILYNEETESKK